MIQEAASEALSLTNRNIKVAMMDPYLEKWFSIIEGMANDNTYKLAWGRSIIECVMTKSYIIENDQIVISFFELAQNILKYYWNQTFFFNLKQGPNINREPEIKQITDQLIKEYKSHTQTNHPVWFNKAEKIIKEDLKKYNQTINKMESALKRDVCWRFLNVTNQTHEVYKLNKEKRTIRIKREHIETLESFGIILIQLMNYKWAQLLEKFNKAPRISTKVKNSQVGEIHRSNLRKYRDILLEEFKDSNPIDFYTGKVLETHEITVDHVIPWSFIYSDDIWNLVLTSKSYNSSKSNATPSKDVIEKLKKRNQNLLDKLSNEKVKSEIKQSLEQNYILRYYLDLAG